MALVTDYFTSQKRPLTTEEIDDVRRVYQRTIRYEFVTIADDLGAQRRPWTEPTGGPLNMYVAHLGRSGYTTTVDPEMRAVLRRSLSWATSDARSGPGSARF